MIKKIKEKGITLIALVVTIIILLILSGVVLNIALNKGLLDKAQMARKITEIESAKEKLEVEKGNLAVEDAGKLDIQKYLKRIKDKGLTSEEDIVENSENSYNVKTDGYIFLVEKDENGDIKIEYLGEEGNLIPKIITEKIIGTSNSITISFKLKYAEKYKIYIRKESEEKGKYEKKEDKKVSSEKVERKIEGLEQKEKYVIKIEAESKGGEKAEKEVNATTIIVEELTEENTTFKYEPSGWTRGPVTTTVILNEEIKKKINEEGYKLQTSIDGKDWDEKDNQIREDNGLVYARLIDSNAQEGKGITGKVEKIDKENPEEATIEIEGEKMQQTLPVSLTAKVTHKDIASGVNIDLCKYILNNNSEEIGTDASNYSKGIFNNNDQIIDIEPSTVGEWYLHVLTVDNVGNSKETIKKITLEEKYHVHEDGDGNPSSATIYSASDPGGCYGASGHVHNKTGTCATKTVYRKCQSGYISSWGDNLWQCDICGTKLNTRHMEHSDHNCRDYACGNYTNVWTIKCNKTTSTLDGYTITY